MFERVLFDVLLEALGQVAESPRALDLFVSGLPLDTTLDEPTAVKDLIKRFAEQKRPIIHSYARDDTEFPCWAIVLAAETEDTRALGDETADDDEDGLPIKASVWNSTFQVLTYSRHPDETLYLYHLLRAILIERRTELVRRGKLANISTLSGAELSPDQVYLPEFLFVRATSLTAMAELGGLALLPPPEGQAQPLPVRQITGLHVRDDRLNDGLRHNVGVLDETEED